ncbi:tigger transposable element-derived protein 4-like [Aricia agestis]|uniref:tigger transposable element-derived protein 4-like n=1 Tax=Aricia agestis TaxID=91739 RepID=UPI001C2040DB|nr:tigger transposable element-derived protein 4-like [Aricia agestis]XP_041968769.1 tigger transposable element-derived protein 4-like [Aricia agestis]XP_041968770.1 tigger transposable element-derived protein 4-like [Aricia agestis]
MTSQRRRKAFTVEEKEAIISRLEKGESNSRIAKEFGVSHSTISTIFKNKKLIKKSYNLNVLKSKRLRKSSYEKVDQALFQWIKIRKNKGVPISGSMLQETANIFAMHFGIVDFNCSASWICRFKVRHNIIMGKITSETAHVDNNGSSSTNWLTLWPDLRRTFSDDEIFNAYETGLFYNSMPHHTLTLKGANCSEGEMSSCRFTVMIAANMSGTEKKKLLVIGKSKPFAGGAESLSVDYAQNSRAWMTSDIFEKWLLDWDLHLGKKGKKILLLVDDRLVHSNVTGLKSISLTFVPSSTALQPMELGVIQSFKTNFRKNFVLQMLNYLDNNKILVKNIKTQDAILMANDAWKKLSQSTIQNSFERAGFNRNHDRWPVQIEQNVLEENDVPFSSWIRNLNLNSIAPPGLWEDYVNIDSSLVTSKGHINNILPFLSTSKTEGHGTDY